MEGLNILYFPTKEKHTDKFIKFINVSLLFLCGWGQQKIINRVRETNFKLTLSITQIFSYNNNCYIALKRLSPYDRINPAPSSLGLAILAYACLNAWVGPV